MIVSQVTEVGDKKVVETARVPLISVITICLNAERTIQKTLQSVADQEGVDGLVDHLVVDGASTDGTLDIVRQFPHVRYVSEPDDGISDAFNKGMRLATGEYLLYLNADDHLFDATVLRDVTEFIRAKHHPDWIVGDVSEASGEEAIIWRRRFPPTCWSLILRNRIAHPAVFLKRQVQRQVGGFDLRFQFAMDYDLWQRLCAKGHKPTHLRRVIAAFACGGKTASSSAQHRAEVAQILGRFRNTGFKRACGLVYERLKGPMVRSWGE